MRKRKGAISWAEGKKKSFSMGANKISYSGLYINWLLALSSESPWVSILWLRFPFSCWLLKHLLKTNAIFASSFFPNGFCPVQTKAGRAVSLQQPFQLPLKMAPVTSAFHISIFDLDHSLRVSVVNHWKHCWSVIKHRSSLMAGKLILSVTCSILEGRWFP